MKYRENCQNVTQWANAIAKMIPIVLLDGGLPQTFHLLNTKNLKSKKKKKSVSLKHYKVKSNKLGGMPVLWN